jgi:hypothetical protein
MALRHDSFIPQRMIPYRQFQSLAQSLQAEVLMLDGVFLEMVRHTRKLNIELYGLYGFYVEIFFDKRTEEPLFLRSFQHTRGLDPYLESIDIEPLFQEK